MQTMPNLIMVQMKVVCYYCKKQFAFDTEKTLQKIMKNDNKLPSTYIPSCTHCGEENEVSVE